MKYILVPIVAIAFSFPCSQSHAGIFSSTATLNQVFNTNINSSSRISNSALNVNRSNGGGVRLTSGVNSASVTADTDSDTGFVSGMSFKPLELTTASRSQNVTIQKQVIDVPANFPIPGTSHLESFLYQDRFTITGISPATPALESSTMGSLYPLYFKSPWFAMYHNLTLEPTSFFVQGTYEAIGPQTTRTIPFSVEFAPVTSLTSLQQTGVQGGSNFGNGFELILAQGLSVAYRAVNPVIFDEQVDDLHFRASFQTNNVNVVLLNGQPLPEAGAMGLMAGIALALGGVAPRRRVVCSNSLGNRW